MVAIGAAMGAAAGCALSRCSRSLRWAGDRPATLAARCESDVQIVSCIP